MSAEDILKKLPRSGFLKITEGNHPSLTQENRAALIRKGNEFFNKGSYDLARRIFITTKYTDGLIRLGDLYYKRKKHLLALQIYWLAPCPEEVEVLVTRMASVMSGWLREERKTQKI
jgi:hypothetical protein